MKTKTAKQEKTEYEETQEILKASNPICGGIYNWHYAKRFSNHNPCEWMRFR